MRDRDLGSAALNACDKEQWRFTRLSMNSTPPHSPRSGAQAQMLGLRVEADQHAGELAGAQGRDRVGAIRYSGEKLSGAD
jgi:hypothetical protein